MKELKICPVCGTKFVATLRKDSRIYACSQKCRVKAHNRLERGLPINNEEFKKGIAERKRMAAIKAHEAKGHEIKPDLKPAHDDKYYECQKEDCQYRASQNLKTCDYILITGHMRGCPVQNCDKYKPGKRVITQPM